jgi:hypothetical protein
MNKKETKNQLNKMYLCRMYYGYILFSKKQIKLKLK